MAFDEVQFPTTIGFDSTGGPQRQSQIVITGSGSEARNARWTNSRRNFEIKHGPHSDNDINTIIGFFEACNAQLIGFRLKFWLDYKSCPPSNTPTALDQTLAVGADTPSVFPLTKTYTNGARSYVKRIYKPVANTVLAAVNGVVKTPGVDFTVDTVHGLILFTSPPAGGAVVTAGFQFDHAVRFNTDQLLIDMSHPGAATITSLPCIELPDSELENA